MQRNEHHVEFFGEDLPELESVPLLERDQEIGLTLQVWRAQMAIEYCLENDISVKTIEIDTIPLNQKQLNSIALEMKVDELLNHINDNPSSQEYDQQQTQWMFDQGLIYESPSDEDLLDWITQGNSALNHLVHANQGLVFSIARKYEDRGLNKPDLIQEGNIGLINGINKYNPITGNKLSTYATWWIRQAMGRATANTADIIRKPVHVVDNLNKLKYFQRMFFQKNERMPSVSEIATHFGITEIKAQQLIQNSLETVALDKPVSNESDATLGDFIETEIGNPVKTFDTQEHLRKIVQLLEILPDDEQQVLKLKYLEPIDENAKKRKSGSTFDQIAEALGIEKATVISLHNRAIKTLRDSASNYLD